MQVIKGTWRVYQALFPPPPHKSLGTRLSLSHVCSFQEIEIHCCKIANYRASLFQLKPYNAHHLPVRGVGGGGG